MRTATDLHRARRLAAAKRRHRAAFWNDGHVVAGVLGAVFLAGVLAVVVAALSF